MKKNFKRWLALLLAVVVVATTCIYAPDHFLHATDGETEGAVEEEEPEVEEQELVVGGESEGEAEPSQEETAAENEVSADDAESPEDPASNEEGNNPDASESEEVKEDTENPDSEVSKEDGNDSTEAGEESEGGESEDDSAINEETEKPEILADSETEEVAGQIQPEVAENKSAAMKASKAVEMPEQTLETHAENTNVTIHAPEGVLPEGTVVTALAVDAENVRDAIFMALHEEGLVPVEITAVDITLSDKEGKTIQPDGNLTVSLENAFNTDIPGTSAAVYHVDQDKVTKIDSADSESERVEFTTDHFSIYAAVKMTASNIENTPMVLSDNVSEVYVGDETEVSCNGYHYDHRTRWISSNKRVAVVNKDGKIEFKKAGKVTIIHQSFWDGMFIKTWYNCGAQYQFNVKEIEATSIALDKTEITLMIGENANIGATVIPDNAKITWNSNNTDVASVDGTGKIIARNIGEAVITAASKDVSASVKVTVVRNTKNDKEQKAYFYALKPGKSDTDANYQDIWFYMGEGKVVAPEPTGKENKYYDFSMVTEYPKNYRNLNIDGVEYTYDASGKTENSYKINWYRIIDSSGANDGNRPITSQNCYHVDGSIELNHPGNVTVGFKVMNPGENAFTPVDGWPKVFKKDSDISDKIPSMSIIEKDGTTYSFGGWYKDENLSQKASAEDFNKVSENTTFYGKYVADEYQLKYVANGGKFEDDSVEITKNGIVNGTEVSLISAPVKEGYSFVGWQRDDDKSVIQSGEASIKMPSHDLVLTAQWEANTVSIIFEINGGDPVEPIEGKTDQAIENTKMPETKKTGYIFSGWYSTPTLEGNKVEELPSVFPAGTTVYYARWEIRKDLTYRVNYFEKDTRKPIEKAKIVGEKTFCEIIESKKEIIDIEGYNYDSVSKDELKIGTGTNAIDIYYTKRTDLSYTVNYIEEVNDEEKLLTEAKVVNNQTFGTIIQSKNEIISIYGYRYDHVDKEELEIGTGENIINIYYSKRNDISYTVKYIESGSDGKELYTSKVIEGKTFNEVCTESAVEIDGYTVDKKEKSITLSADSSKNILTFVYTRIGTLSYTVNYLEKDTNKVLHEIKSVSDQTFGTEIKIADEVIDIEGYNYDSASEDILTIGSENNIINLYYTKKVNLEYEIHYYFNNVEDIGSAVKVDKAVFDNEIEYDTTLSKEYNGSTYVFERAALKKNLDKNIATVTRDGEITVVKELVKVSVNPEDNIIYVYYVSDESGPNGKGDNIPDSEEYHVTYKGNGGTTKIGDATYTDPNIYPKRYDPVYASMNQFTKENAVFVGWKIEGDDIKLIPEEQTFVMQDHDMTLIAQWKTLTVEKTYSSPVGKASFNVGDMIDFAITVTNSGDVSLTNIVVTDYLAGAVLDEGLGYTIVEAETEGQKRSVARIDSLKAGDSVVVKAHYTVKAEDIGKENFTNVASATTEGLPVIEKETEKIPMGGSERQLAVRKEVTNYKASGTTGAGDAAFTTGDTVKFDIVVTNTSGETVHNIVVKELLEGASIVGNSLLDNLITQIISDEAVYRIEDGNAVISSLDPGESVTVKAEYTIKEGDLEKTDFSNTVVAVLEGKEFEASVPVRTETLRKHLNIDKTVENPGKNYALGEEVEYKIVVTNDGNMVLNNIVVEDELTGNTEENGNAFIIEKLGINESKEFTVHYTITEEDIRKGEVVNVATAKGAGTDPNEEKPEGKETIQTESPDPRLTLTKTTPEADAERIYKLGDTITYHIVAKNDGNVDLTDIRIEDELTGNVGDQGTFVIDRLKPGESSDVMVVTYTVTDMDVLTGNGVITNIATATCNTDITDPDNSDKQTVLTFESNKKEDPIEKPGANLSIIKTADKTTNVKPGDEITYTITVINNGMVTLKDIDIVDELTGDMWRIVELAPKKFWHDTVTYTVTEADLLKGSVTNIVTASGTDQDGNAIAPEDGTAITQTERINTNYTVTKRILNPQSEYIVDDSDTPIRYEITVTSQANVTLHNVVVKDQLEGASGQVTFTELGKGTLNADNSVTIPELAPGETVTLNCEYIVRRADAGKNLVNTAIAAADPVVPADSENPTPVTPDEKRSSAAPASAEDIYTLTIHYRYASGREAAPDVVAQYLEGESFFHRSPSISGYRPNHAFIRSGNQGMPARDVEVTVTYRANASGSSSGTTTTDPTPNPGPGAAPGVTPDNTTPAAGGTTAPAAGTAPAAADGVAVPDNEVPMGAMVQLDEDGSVDIVPVADENVPLSAREFSRHMCCVLHLILMLASMIILASYTSRRKRCQARIFELTEQLRDAENRRR